MTQIVTISASTAAIAAEPLKASARVSGATPIESTVMALSEKTRRTGDAYQKMLMEVVHPPALALFFLTTNQQQLPQTTRDRAEDEYLMNALDRDDGAVSETEEAAEGQESEGLALGGEESDLDQPVTMEETV